MTAKPVRLVHGQAALRINDIGGWTDTWFAGEGKVLNLAVGPPVEVQVKAFPGSCQSKNRVLVRADNYGQAFRFNPRYPSLGRHPLLQFAIASVPWPKKYHLEIRIHSPVPAGMSAGTSASVCVALLAALFFLAGRPVDPGRIAKLAHAIETEKLGLQSGIQDQISAAYGGVCYIRMVRYPRARVKRLLLRAEVLSELNRRLVLVGLGRPHRSSVLHEQVIALLSKSGARFKHLERMRGLAEAARSHLEQGDLESYGRIMSENNECQRALSRKLISPEADEVIRLARKRRASGWKVNGAGGRGGSLTLLASADDGLRRALLQDILTLGKGIRPLPFYISSSGLAAWDVGRGLDRA